MKHRVSAPTKAGSKSAKRITLATLATHLGVTANTVSAALRGSSKISEDRRAKIQRLAAEWGYQPHLGAQSLRLRNTGHVGLLLSSWLVAYGFQNPILRAFTSGCQARGLRYQVEWCNLGQKIPTLVSEGVIDGLLIGGRMDASMANWLTESCPIPHVQLAEPGLHAVCSDARGNQRRVMDFLIGLGHRRIALMSVPGGISTFHTESTQAFIDIAKEAEVDTNQGRWIICHQDPDPASNRQPLEAQIYAMLRLNPRPTAVVCMGLNLAQVVLVAALRAGISVPYELSILVHTAAPMAAEAYPRFSVLDPDSEAMAEAGLDNLAILLAGGHSPQDIKRIPGRLVSFDTTTVPPPER